MGRVQKFLKRAKVYEHFLEIQHKITKSEKKALFLEYEKRMLFRC